MKRTLLTILGLLLSQVLFAQEWHAINSKSTESYSVNLVESTDKSVIVDLSINGFYTVPVADAALTQSSVIIMNDGMIPIVEAGQPNIPSFSIPVIVSDYDKMDIRVKAESYIEYENIDIAPSKGDFPRSINPDDVPYTYGEEYNNDAFFPAVCARLDSPYILRDYRAQNIIVTPFTYNPVSKTLRVMSKMTIEVFAVKGEAENVLSRRSNTIKLDPEYDKMYSSRFINYNESKTRYTAVEEDGDLLVICFDDFLDEMQPFVEWKRAIGRETTIVATSESGRTAEEIKAYLSAEYEANPDLTHVLFVGDFAELPGKYMNMGYEYSGYSDWWFGQLSGNDYYNELIIGRFSAESAADVTTQVDRVINYERDINTDATWLTVAQGISHKENKTGHNGEDDYQHIDIIREDLLNYNYTEVYREYDNVSGVSSSAAIVSQHINEGVGIINYCNHGMTTGWSVFNYRNAQVNALTNDNKLPFIISVACNNGEYTYTYEPCFAEAWLRATNVSTGEPTGAIGGMFSYISQPWVPPMYGQDEMIDIFTESYSNNIKRTMGGVALNGNLLILDIGHHITTYYATYNTWHLFGDPTLTLRSDVPETMDVTHYSDMSKKATAFVVSAENAEGARATLSRNGEIMGTALVNDGEAVISFNAPMQLGQATLTVFGFNKVTYQATINIVEDANHPLVVDVTTNKRTVTPGMSVYLNATAIGGSCEYSYSWSPTTGVNGVNMPNPIVTPTETTTYTCTVNDGNVTSSSSITITVMVPPANLKADVDGNNVTLTWDEMVPGAQYNIYRDNKSIATNVDGTTYTDEGLLQDYYVYKVSSVYDGVESAKSNGVQAVVLEMAINAYANPSLIAKGESTTLLAHAIGAGENVTYSWTPAESLENPDNSTTVAWPTETTTYTITAVSGSQTATATLTVEVLVDPVNVTAVADGTDVTVTWDEVELAEYYTVSRDGSLISSYVSSTSFVDNDVDLGSHCYTVQSVRGAFVSPQSEEACVDILENCSAPKNVTAEFYEYDGEFGALVNWDKQESVSELTEFRIYRSTDNVEYKLVQSLVNVPGMTHYQYSDMNNTNGTYYYKVSAYYASIDCESEFGIAADSSDDFVMVDVISIDENKDENVMVYPNPVGDRLTVKANRIEDVAVVNMMGQFVFKQEVSSDEIVLDVSDFDSGMYLLHIKTESGTIIRQINIIR